MSDTFFGHFCWAALYEKGESFLEDFLALYGAGKAAPVLFSSAFVSGYLPRPVLPQPKREQIRGFVQEYFVQDPDGRFPRETTDKQKRFKGMTTVKSWNKLRFVRLEDWVSLKNDYSEFRLLEIFYDRFKTETEKADRICETEVTASNSISRTDGMVLEEGGLFQREKTWYHEGTELDLYVEVNSEELAPLVKWFLTDYLPRNGFGKDKSVGIGYMQISPDDLFNPDVFDVNGHNACVSLSLTAFEGMEQYEAFYRLIAKFGKLGGDYAVSSPSGGAVRPFKKPILMIEPGGVFLAAECLNKKPLLDRVHSDERIRHCGIPVTLPVKIREDEFNVKA